MVSVGAFVGAPFAVAAEPGSTRSAGSVDPFGSLVWDDLKRIYLGETARVVFDDRVKVRGPTFADDPMNVPVTIKVQGLEDVQRIIVMVDRNPIRKVLEYQPLSALPALSFRFKLEQASPVRAAAQTRDGLWHVGGTEVASAGGGCTVPGTTRADGSWSQTLGLVNGQVLPSSPAVGRGGSPAQGPSARLRLRVMHPMDTGLAAGVPAFYLSQLSVFDARDRELLRLQTFEPVSENPVLHFDFPEPPAGPLRIEGRDNNGNRIHSRIDP